MTLTHAIQTLIFAAFASALAMVPVTNAAPPPAATPPATADTPYDPTKPAALVTPAVAPAIPASPAKLLLDAVRASGGKSFLWEVKSKTNVVYLFGTIHVGKRTFYPLPPQVEAALKQSQRLVVEADISNTDGLANIDAIINYQAPDSLDKHIPAPLFERLKTQFSGDVRRHACQRSFQRTQTDGAPWAGDIGHEIDFESGHGDRPRGKKETLF